MSKGKRPKNLIIVIIVVAAILVIAGLAAGSQMYRYKAREAEVKSGLHEIRLAIERFSADNSWTYPRYLIGGEAKWAIDISLTPNYIPFTGIVECEPLSSVSDPLLSAGYLTSYPRNPFTRDGLEIYRIQAEVAKSNLDGDPLRNGHELGELLGTRFGAQCNLMGQVLCDARWAQLLREINDSGKTEQWYTGSAVEYRMWDQFADKKPTGTYMPGMFFYKGVGLVMAVDNDSDSSKELSLPTEINMYLLGAYGGPTTKGKDIFGESESFVFFVREGGTGTGPAGANEIYFRTRTHSELSIDGKQGDPFSQAHGDSAEQFQYGNSNGIPDGIILITSSSDCY